MAVQPKPDPQLNSAVSYLVTQDVLAIELGPLLKARLVKIPAKSTVEWRCFPSVTEFVEIIWQGKAHLIFGADRSRLNLIEMA